MGISRISALQFLSPEEIIDASNGIFGPENSWKGIRQFLDAFFLSVSNSGGSGRGWAEGKFNVQLPEGIGRGRLGDVVTVTIEYFPDEETLSIIAQGKYVDSDLEIGTRGNPNINEAFWQGQEDAIIDGISNVVIDIAGNIVDMEGLSEKTKNHKNIKMDTGHAREYFETFKNALPILEKAVERLVDEQGRFTLTSQNLIDAWNNEMETVDSYFRDFSEFINDRHSATLNWGAPQNAVYAYGKGRAGLDWLQEILNDTINRYHRQIKETELRMRDYFGKDYRSIRAIEGRDIVLTRKTLKWAGIKESDDIITPDDISQLLVDLSFINGEIEGMKRDLAKNKPVSFDDLDKAQDKIDDFEYGFPDNAPNIVANVPGMLKEITRLIGVSRDALNENDIDTLQAAIEYASQVLVSNLNTILKYQLDLQQEENRNKKRSRRS